MLPVWCLRRNHAALLRVSCWHPTNLVEFRDFLALQYFDLVFDRLDALPLAAFWQIHPDRRRHTGIREAP
jgi:hypothetical protein